MPRVAAWKAQNDIFYRKSKLEHSLATVQNDSLPLFFFYFFIVTSREMEDLRMGFQLVGLSFFDGWTDAVEFQLKGYYWE